MPDLNVKVPEKREEIAIVACVKAVPVQKEIVIEHGVAREDICVECPISGICVKIGECLSCPHFVSLTKVRKSKIKRHRLGWFDVDLPL